MDSSPRNGHGHTNGGGSMRPIVLRTRAFSQIEDSSTRFASYPVHASPVPAAAQAPLSPPRSTRKTVAIKHLVSPSRSPTTSKVTSPVSTSSASKAAAIAASARARELFISASPATPTIAPTPTPAMDDKTQRILQWKEEAARLSQRVKELERENSQLRSGKKTQFATPYTDDSAVLSDQENTDDTNHNEAIRTRMHKSKSVASGVGVGALSTGLTVAEAIAASHRSRSKRLGMNAPATTGTEPLRKYKSGYWNEQSNIKSSFSCNNLLDMDRVEIEKPVLVQSQTMAQARPLSLLHRANSTNTKSSAKMNRDIAALMRSGATSARKSDSFQRGSMDAGGEDLAAVHKQQLAIAHSFRGSNVTRMPPSANRPEWHGGTGTIGRGDDSTDEDDWIRVTSPHSQREAGLRGLGGPFRLPNRAHSMAATKRPNSSDVRLWVGTWNMGAADPFVDKSGIIDEQASAAMLQQFVPHGYHMYVLGLQEGVSENAYHAVVAYLNRNETGMRYYRLELKNSDSLVANKSHPGEATIDAVRGRGDGAFVGTKFTGLAVFYAAPVQDKIKLLRAGVHKFALTSGSKGGVAAALMINQTSIVFVNCHLDARNDSYRREQIRNLNANLGKVMGHANFDLTEQFHHVVWMGDMNYRIVHLDPDIVLHMLEEGRNTELHDKFDGLLNDRRNGGVFDGFTEPNKFPDFYPTYKKFPKRGRVIYQSPSWSRLVYRVLYKEPFYKGGKVKKRVPGWCDRILIHSLLVSDSKLMPEKVLSPFDEPQTWIDNYRSVNDGDGMDVSDHSPVYATFTLSFPQQANPLSSTPPHLVRRNSRSLSSVSNWELPSSQPRSSIGGSYFDNPNIVRRIAANVPNRPISTVLRIFNMQLFWNDNVVVPKRTRVVAPLIGEDIKQCDVIGERCQGTNGLNLSLNAVVQHTRPLKHLHMLVWIKNETITGHCTLSLKRIARQEEGGEVKFRVPLYNNSMRLYYDGHPLVLIFSVRSKTFAK